MTREQSEAEYISRVLCDSSILLESRLTPEMFTTYRGVYATILKLSASGPVGVMDVVYNLPESQRRLVSSLDTFTAARWQHYHKAVFEAWAKDQADTACRVSMEQSYPENVATLETALTALSMQDSGSKTVSVRDLLEPVVRRVMERRKDGGKMPGLSTGFPLIDAATMGLQDGQFIFIGARPSDGKSSLGWQMARHQARTVKVGWIALEESEDELMIRGIAAEGKLDSRGVTSGDFSPDEFVKMREGVAKMEGIQDSLFVHAKPGMKLPQLLSEIRSMARRGCKVVYVDYVQIVVVEGAAPKHLKVGEVSSALKAIAAELKIPIVGLGQLKRPDVDRAPTLLDIQHSDQPGQDADQAWFIWPKLDKDGNVVETWIIIRKVRNGSKRWVKVKFDGPTLTFEEVLGQ